LDLVTISPGQGDVASGRGCSPDIPVVLSIDGVTVGKAMTDAGGRFTVQIDTEGVAVGPHTVVAHCGPTLTAGLAVAVVASSPGVSVALLFVLIVLLFVLYLGYRLLR
jgi:hypothetical protein